MSNEERNEERIEQQRRLVVQALTLGVLTGGLGWNTAAVASWFGKVPRKLPPNSSIFDYSGTVLVNNQAVTPTTIIRAGDSIFTGDDSHVVLVIGDTALTLRGKSLLETSGRDLLVGTMRLVTGGLLAVFGKRKDEVVITTPTATIGIRGTGIYAEADPEVTYFCTCYGTTNIASTTHPDQAVQVTSRHHDAGKYVLANPEKGQRITPAPFKNHTDIELMTLEALVGREVPFKMPGATYNAPRRDY